MAACLYVIHIAFIDVCKGLLVSTWRLWMDQFSRSASRGRRKGLHSRHCLCMRQYFCKNVRKKFLYTNLCQVKHSIHLNTEWPWNLCTRARAKRMPTLFWVFCWLTWWHLLSSFEISLKTRTIPFLDRTNARSWGQRASTLIPEPNPNPNLNLIP